MENIVYAPLGWLFHCIAWMPWRVLYFISDILYFIVYKLIRYRLKIVRRNLRECFPERGEAELISIERKFYRHFTDYFVETIKMLHVSDDEMRRRMVFRNAEYVGEALASGQSVVLYAAHYCNWEWLTSITLWFGEDSFKSGAVMGQAYQPLENRWFDKFFLRLRERFNTRCIAKQMVLREMLTGKRTGRHLGIGFIADQHPLKGHEDYVRLFLNHPTAILTGPEAIARKLDCRAVYFDVRKVSRGHYECEMLPMSDHSSETAMHELTDRFADILESRISAEPAYWLWTHNRWKRAVVISNDN